MAGLLPILDPVLRQDPAAVGAERITNLFDREPPLSGQVTTFQRGYDPRFTDPLGRSIMLRAAYKFF